MTLSFSFATIYEYSKNDPPQRVRGGGDPSNRWFDVLWAPTGRMDPPVFPWRIAFSSVPVTSAALVSDVGAVHK